MTYAKRFDLLIEAVRRATPRGRQRFLASHRNLVRRGVHLPHVPDGFRAVAGKLVPLPKAVGNTCAAVCHD